METAAEEQTNLGLDLEVARHDDIIDINRDDEFDFEIDGHDDLGTAEEADDANNNLIYQADVVQPHNDDSYTYQPQEQALQATIVESYGDESHDQGDESHDQGDESHDQGDDQGDNQVHEDLDFGVSVFEATGEAGDFTEPTQDDSQGGYENKGADEEHIQRGVDEELYYEENAGEFESFENTTQSEADQDHGLMKNTTSVDYVHEGGDLQDPAQETTAETNESEYLETAEDVAAEKEYDGEEHAQEANVAAEDAENRQIGGDSASAPLAKDDPPTEMVDESHWDTEGHGDQLSKARPNVTVSYRGQEYFLFSEAQDEDPDTYFLDDVDSIHRPLSQFLENVREVISSEVEASNEVFMKIDGLGLEFGESTTKDFLSQTTLAEIIEVNNKLVQHDGGSQSPELYIFLSVRSNPLYRFTELAKGADEGQGLSNFEKYYDEASGDASTRNEEEQSDFPQDIISDDLSLDDAYEDTEDATGGPVDSHDVQQYHNPFRVDEGQQQSFVEADISDVVHVEAAEHETLAINAMEEQFSAENVNDSVEFADGGDQNGLELDTTDVRETSIDDALVDVASISGQGEEGAVEDWADALDGESHGPQGSTDGGEAEEFEKQGEMLIDFPQEELERTDDPATNAADDDDYLDLGNDDDHEQTATEVANDYGTGHLDTPQQMSHNSSATATLDGEDDGHGDDAAAIQDHADPGQDANQTEFDTSQPEVDEIDWNHDEDDEIAVTDQNPGDLSPSSLSAKRSRQEDGGADDSGDENVAKRRRT